MDHDVRCPRCDRRASWTPAFEGVPTRRGRPIPDDDPRPIRRWGGWFLRERFPAVFPWRAPRERAGHYFVHGEFGVVRCPECHFIAPRPLRWPADAFFRWDIRGTPLWARDAAHARVLLDYVGSTLRDPSKYGAGHARALRRLPARVLAGRNRELVVRRIADSLRAAAVDATPAGDPG